MTNFHYSVMGEMRALQQAGLPNLEILRMATSRAALTFGLTDGAGTITAGATADLLLVHGNPLTDLEAVAAVAMVEKQGRIVFRQPPSGETSAGEQ